MFIIPLTNSELSVEVSEQDYLTLLLLGPWYDNGAGYAITTRSPQELLHHVVAKLMGLVIVEEVDHIDRNTHNAKRTNLRLATKSEQTINQKLRDGSVSGHKNISKDYKRNQWRVHIRRNGKLTYIGRYNTLEEAIRQRDNYFERSKLFRTGN